MIIAIGDYIYPMTISLEEYINVINIITGAYINPILIFSKEAISIPRYTREEYINPILNVVSVCVGSEYGLPNQISKGVHFNPYLSSLFMISIIWPHPGCGLTLISQYQICILGIYQSSYPLNHFMSHS